MEFCSNWYFLNTSKKSVWVEKCPCYGPSLVFMGFVGGLIASLLLHQPKVIWEDAHSFRKRSVLCYSVLLSRVVTPVHVHGSISAHPSSRSGDSRGQVPGWNWANLKEGFGVWIHWENTVLNRDMCCPWYRYLEFKLNRIHIENSREEEYHLWKDLFFNYGSCIPWLSSYIQNMLADGLCS